MRVGIVTFHSVDNHGALLQAYALQSFLHERGHDATIIDYRPRCFESRKQRSGHVTWRTVLRRLRQAPREAEFEKFRVQHLRRTRTYYTLEELRTDPPACDVYIAGSDQVWSPIVDGRNEVDLAYFLAFGDAACKRISYAASFGVRLEHIPEEFVAAIKGGLRHLDAISVREQSGGEIVSALAGKIAAWCVDPVFLLSDAAKKQLMMTRAPREHRYVFAYMLHPANAILPLINEFARNESLRLVRDHCLRDEVFHVLHLQRPLSPSTWLSCLTGAALVITSSFHGVACSILQRRPFIYVEPSGKGRALAERVIPLLARLGLMERCVPERALTIGTVESQYRTAVDWDMVARRLAPWVADSSDYLQSALRR